MTGQEERALEILRELASRPAVPFFEGGPARFLKEALSRLPVELSQDSYGNIVARYTRDPLPHQPPVAFVAHMDHPGFEVVEATRGRAVARALGGVPVASLKKPTPALVLAPGGGRVPAELQPADEQAIADHGERSALLVLKEDVELVPPAPVVFDLPDFALDGDTIRMRALDDLAGCAAGLATLERVIDEGKEADVLVVFTRAEEGGLYGARLLAEAEAIPRDTLVISVEASAVIPGVAQGEGPVIRNGDAAYTFDGEAEQVLMGARDAIRARKPDFKVQRQLMSGGTCEGTAFALRGMRVAAMAFPLGNYHNATDGVASPDGGVDAEHIRLPDFLGGIQLLAQLVTTTADRDYSPARKRFGPVPDEVRRRLEESAREL